MKKQLLLLLVLAPLCLFAQQTHHFGSLDSDNIWTGNNTFFRLVPGHGTVSQLPPLPLPWTVFIVTDGSSATDCTGGGGIFTNWCGYNGSGWVPLGGGGGGGSTPPAGGLNDIQLNYPLGAFGTDSSIFQEDPTTHTFKGAWVANFAQQVNVTDTTNNGRFCQGHTTGSSIDGHFCFAVPTGFTPGDTGIDWPTSPALGSLTITSLTPGADGLLPTAWTSGGGGGSVSYEPLNYLFSTVCSSPTTCSDLVSTPLAWLGSAVFMAPPPLTNPLAALGEVCPVSRSNSSTLTLSCTFNTPFVPGDGIAVFTDSLTGSGDFATFTFADTVTNPTGTYHNSYSILDFGNDLSTPMADAVTLNMAQGGYITLTATQSGGLTPYGSWNLIAVHLHHVNAVDVHSFNATTWSAPGIATNLSPVSTATSPDVVLSTAQSATSPNNVLTAGAGFAIPVGGQLHTTTVGGSLDTLAVEATNVIPAGAVQPTIVGTQQPFGGPAGNSFTIGFTYSGSSITSGLPEPRYPTLQDVVSWGVLPDPTGRAGSVIATTDGVSYSLITGPGTGNVTGTFTTNCIPKGTAAHALGDSSICDDGTTVVTTEAVDLSGAASFKPKGGGGTLTIGSSNQNWATLGTGIVKNTTTTGALSNAGFADVANLWASGSCVGFLKNDGTCGTLGSGANVALSNLSGVAINTSLLAASAASANLGTNLVPWGNVFIGGTSNESLSFVTSALTTNRTLTIPDANSNPVQGIANPSDTNVINYISTDGVQHRIAGGGTVSSVTGTTNQVDVATTTTTPVISLDGQFTSVNYATCTNTSNALTVTLSPAPTSLVNGLTAQCKSSAANSSTTPTLNVNGLGAHTIVKGGSSGQAALVNNDILTNMVARFTYNSATTTWELQNPQQLAAGAGTVTSIATTAPITGGTITTTGTIACATCVVASSPGAGIARFAGSTQTVTSAELSGAVTTSGSNVTTLGTSYRTRSCEIVWGGTGTAGVLSSGDDAISNQSCFNKIGVTETITAVYCRSDAGSNTTTVNPTFGASGTGTTICSGALTCGSSGAYSSTCTVSNGALTDGTNINPVMSGTLTGTSIHVLFTYTLP